MKEMPKHQTAPREITFLEIVHSLMRVAGSCAGSRERKKFNGIRAERNRVAGSGSGRPDEEVRTSPQGDICEPEVPDLMETYFRARGLDPERQIGPKRLRSGPGRVGSRGQSPGSPASELNCPRSSAADQVQRKQAHWTRATCRTTVVADALRLMLMAPPPPILRTPAIISPVIFVALPEFPDKFTC